MIQRLKSHSFNAILWTNDEEYFFRVNLQEWKKGYQNVYLFSQSLQWFKHSSYFCFCFYIWQVCASQGPTFKKNLRKTSRQTQIAAKTSSPWPLKVKIVTIVWSLSGIPSHQKMFSYWESAIASLKPEVILLILRHAQIAQMCLSGSHKWKHHDFFHGRILNISQNRVLSGLSLQFPRHSQTCLDPWADMAHAQAETGVHLNL